jgi:hypothetical protein
MLLRVRINSMRAAEAGARGIAPRPARCAPSRWTGLHTSNSGVPRGTHTHPARGAARDGPLAALAAPPLPQSPPAVPQPAGSGAPAGAPRYPFIDPAFRGLELLHAEPPVYLVHGMLSRQECGALIRAAEGGALDGLEYDNAGGRGGGVCVWGGGEVARAAGAR